MVHVNKLAGDGSNTVTCLRYTGDTMLYTRMLKGHGVSVCFIDDGIMTCCKEYTPDYLKQEKAIQESEYRAVIDR